MWKKFSELRKIESDISNFAYPKWYAEKNYEPKSYRSIGINWIEVSELIDIRLNNSKIEWRFADRIQNESIEKSKDGVIYRTQYGVFCSNNRGEFGGCLYTPNKCLSGNFVTVFDYESYVIAIDSRNHLGLGHINIYAFDKNLEYRIIYSNKSISNFRGLYFNQKIDVKELSYYETHTIDNNNLVLFVPTKKLVTGYIDSYTEYFSYIITIDKKLNVTITLVTDYYGYVQSIVIDQYKIYLGVDKEILVYDKKSTAKEIFTPLSNDKIKMLSSWSEIHSNNDT